MDGASTIASLIIALMSGSIPDFEPLNWLYNLLFSTSLPDYLIYGFTAIGLFSLFYSLTVVLIITPISCTLNGSLSTWFNKLSTEDLIFIPLVYIVYLAYLYHYDLLTPTAASVGILAVMLPFIYRLTVYTIDKYLRTDSCYRNLYLFFISFILLIPISALYLIIVHTVITYVTP